MELPRPDPQAAHLADVAPSLLAAMGVAGFSARLGDRFGAAGEAAGACLLLVDGLGAELLDAHLSDAPFLATLRGPTSIASTWVRSNTCAPRRCSRSSSR